MRIIYGGLFNLFISCAPEINLPCELKLVLEEAVKAVNFIKSKPSNSRIFKGLCKEMLTFDFVLRRLFDLRQEIFLKSKKLFTKLYHEKWNQASIRYFFFKMPDLKILKMYIIFGTNNGTFTKT